MTVQPGIDRIARRVGDLARSEAFYAAIGFRPEGAARPMRPDLAAAMGLGPDALRLPLRIGRQRLDLVASPASRRPAPRDEGSDASPRPGPAANDPAFQHLAIPVRAMDRAMAALAAVSPAPISRGGAQLLPASSGGVVAFKFRDPDGHPLELIAFPSGPAAERWAEAPGLFLGIDHTAVTVSSLAAALAFFEGELGFERASQGLNRGPEQARLDGLADPVVDVLALTPPRGPTPHLELLHYREPAFRAPARPRPPTTWTILAGAPGQAGLGPARRLDAPDGHGVLAGTD